MSFWFESIRNEINVEVVRQLAELEDETLKTMLAVMICHIANGVVIPNKAGKTYIAKELLKKGIHYKKIMSVTGISKRHVLRLKKEIQDGE